MFRRQLRLGQKTNNVSLMVLLNANASFCVQGLRWNRALLMVERGHAVLSG
jgi:hypothetical protein